MNLWLDGNRLLTVGRLCTAYDLLGLLFFLSCFPYLSHLLLGCYLTLPSLCQQIMGRENFDVCEFTYTADWQAAPKGFTMKV